MRLRVVVVPAVLVGLLLLGCSASDDATLSGTVVTTAPATASTAAAPPRPPQPSAEARRYIAAANEICQRGRDRAARIVAGHDVVPRPRSDRERAASRAWAAATAAELAQTSIELAALEVPAGRAVYRAVYLAYADAAAHVRAKGSAVLAEPQLLVDAALADLGFTDCFARA